MLRRILVIAAIVAAGGLIWILQTTTPASVHPLVVLLVFVMLYMLVLAVLTFFIFWVSQILVKILHLRRGAVQPAELSFTRAYLYASVLAFAPVALLAMRSVGQQGIGDVLLVVLFEVLACFYVWRRS